MRTSAGENGMAQRNGTGMFPPRGCAETAMRLLPSKRFAGPFAMNRFPLLPLEEEGRLNDLRLRENFIERVFACPAPFAGPTIAGHEC
jgi:hypothetical protein